MRTPLEIRTQLRAELGSSGLAYWRTLSEYLNAKISKMEFDEVVKQFLTTNHLQQLHNSLLISIITAAGSTAPPSAVPLVARERKRKRLRAFQGDEDEATESRSKRLKQWAIGAGKPERDRLRALELGDPQGNPRARDEVARPRAISIGPEPQGAEQQQQRTQIRLASTTRGITVQHLHERLSHASAQHGLSSQVSKQAAQLTNLALEAMLKRVIASALSTTTSSRAISSIRAVAPPSTTLNSQAFAAALEIAPSTAMPGPSAAVTRLALAERDVDYSEERDRSGWTLGRSKAAPPRDDPRWHALTILRERSGVRQVLDLI